MRVAFLTEFYPTTIDADVQGGVEMHLFQLSQRLGEKHEVSVVARCHSAAVGSTQVGTVEVKRVGPPTTYSQGGNLIARIKFVFAAVSYVKKSQFDLVVSGNFVCYFIAKFLPKKYRQKTALIYHDVWIGEWVKHVGLVAGIVGEVIERITRAQHWGIILANSEVTKCELIHHRFHANRIEVLPCGTDGATCRSVVPKIFGLPTIVVVARLVTYKRVQDVIQMMTIVRQHVDAQLVIIGSGPERSRLEKMVHDLHLSSVVNFTGHAKTHREVLSVIKGANVFCLPSSVEGFGIVTIEAMACGTPYVSSDIPPTREVTNGGIGGILYPVGNVEALANGVLQILKSDDERNRLSQEGLLQAQQYDYQNLGQIFQSKITGINEITNQHLEMI